MHDVVIKHKDAKFTVGLVQEEKYFQQTVRGQHYAPVYDGRVFDYLAHRVVARGKARFDNRIVIAGPPRTGKSTIACTWARRIDPDFPVENVSFRLADYKDRLASLPPADPVKGKWPMAVLDESGVDLYSKDWATRHVKDMVKVFQIIGMKRLTMMMCLPHRNLLAKDMRDEMHWWINTCMDDDELRGYCEVRYAKPNPWATPYWNPLFGIVYDELNDSWWREYESYKNDFIEEYTRTAPVEPTEREKHLVRQRDVAIVELRKRGFSAQQVETIIGVKNVTRLERKIKSQGA